MTASAAHCPVASNLKSTVMKMVVCAGSLTITFDPTSGQRSYLDLENFHEVVGDTKLQTLPSYKARFLTALLNRHVKESVWPLKWTASV